MLARESAATMTPSLNMNASVVVPFAGFTICIASFWNPSNWNRRRKTKSHITPCELEIRQNTKHVFFFFDKIRNLSKEKPLDSSLGSKTYELLAPNARTSCRVIQGHSPWRAKQCKIPNTLELTLIVFGSSNDGVAENPSRSSLLVPKSGAVDSRPLVSSFMLLWTVTK